MRRLAGLGAALVMASCTPSIGAMAGRSVGRATTVGGTARALLQIPRSYQAVGGMQIDGLAQADPKTDAEQVRFSLVGGYGRMPDAHEGRVGWLALARVGYVRGVYGGGPSGVEYTPGGALAGATFELPIRLGTRHAPWNDDPVADISCVLIPAFNATELYAWDVTSRAQTELGGSLSIGIRLWSSLAP